MEALALLGGPPVRASWLPYARQTVESDDVAAVSRVLTADWITQGPAVADFERALAAHAGVAHAVAAKVSGVVITSSSACAATANAIVHQGARPVFADVEGRTP